MRRVLPRGEEEEYRQNRDYPDAYDGEKAHPLPSSLSTLSTKVFASMVDTPAF